MNCWDRVIGQKRVAGVVQAALASKRFPHAWLFSGEEGVGKDAMAIAVAQSLRCDRPDGWRPCGTCRGCTTTAALGNPNVQFIFALPTGKGEDTRADSPLLKLSDSEIALVQQEMARKAADGYHNIAIPKAQQIKISSIRQVKRDVSMSSTEPGWRVVIVSEAHRMRDEAANAFLKTLEEPNDETLLILTTSRREGLLPTIVSRCQEVRFDLLSDEEIAAALVERKKIDQTSARLLARLSGGSYSRAAELADGELNELRQDVVAFLRGVLRRSPSATLAEIERLTAGNDRAHQERVLSLLALWLRDAMALRHVGIDDVVINQDQLADLRSFVGRFGEAPFDSLIEEVERSARAVRSNAQSQLVFTVLAMKLVDACYGVPA